MAAEEEGSASEEDINPFTMILPKGDDNGQEEGPNSVSLPIATKQLLLQKHLLPSIDSTVVIRQLPSRGLSFQLWPAATVLVSLIDQHRSDHSSGSPLSTTISAFSNHRPLSILEIGSGTGIVGIAAAALLGANVTVTDLPHVVPNLQFNADANAELLAANGGAVYVGPLRWGHEDDVELLGRDFDIVMASDVVYHDHLYEPLLQTLRSLLLVGAEQKKRAFVMAHLRRWKKESAFFRKAKKMFQVDVLHCDKPSEGSRIGVTVYRFVEKKASLSPS